MVANSWDLEDGPEKPGKTQLEEIREMLGHILLGK